MPLIIAVWAVWATVKVFASTGTWLVVDIGIIGTSSEDILNQAMAEASEIKADGIVVRLDTAGGALENTRNMVKSIMASEIPIVVWVGPPGSRAGSAGAFITISGHIAAMAPGTNIGAAHPIQATGKDVESGELDRKVMNDTLAFMESIAKERGRNVEMARSFVATSVSITADEALEHKVIDLIAKDTAQLFEAIDGREVTLQGGSKVTLSTQNVTTVIYERSFRQKMLEIFSNPNLFYLLFMAGLVGIGYELSNPGMMFPGIVGGICLILALMATSVLPVSWAAAALILLGIGLLVAEAFIPSFGILGIGGFVAFVLGSIFLVDPNNEYGLRISWYTILPGVVLTASAFLIMGILILRAERAPVISGRQGMLGEQGRVVTSFKNGVGQVHVHGAVWRAKAEDQNVTFERDDRVIVKEVDSLTVIVSKVT